MKPEDETSYQPGQDDNTPASQPAENTTKQPYSSLNDYDFDQTDTESTNSTSPANSDSFSSSAAFTNPDGPATNPAPLTNPFFNKPKKSRKKKVLVSLAVVLLLVIAAAVAAWLWYSSPSKALSDAVDNLMKTPVSSATGSLKLNSHASDENYGVKGDFDLVGAKNNSGKLDVDMNITGKNSQGSTYSSNLKLAVIAGPDNTVYVKVSQLKQLIKDSLLSQGTSASDVKDTLKYFQPVFDKADNKWVKISKDDLKNVGLESPSSPTNNSQIECVKKAVADFRSSKEQQQQIKTAFNNHQFIGVDKSLGSRKINDQDSVGYSLKLDEAKAKEFGSAVKDSQIVTKLKTCLGDSLNSVDDKSDSNTKVSMRVWINRWNHKFTEVSLIVNDKDIDMTMDMRPSYNESPDKIKVPEQATSIEELRQAFMQSIGASLGAAFSESPTSTLQ